MLFSNVEIYTILRFPLLIFVEIYNKKTRPTKNLARRIPQNQKSKIPKIKRLSPSQTHPYYPNNTPPSPASADA